MRKARIAVQLTVLACFIALIFINCYPHGFRYPADLFLRLDPYAALATAVATRKMLWRLLPALVVLASALVVGRAFCGWICPLGTALDGFSTLAGLKVRARRAGRLASIRYLILASTLGASAVGATLVHFFDPLVIAERSGIFILRKVTSAVVLGLSDLVPSSRALGALASSAPLEDRFYGLAALFAVLAAALLLAEAINRRFWCRYLCPLGALLSLPAGLAPLRRLVRGCEDTDRCKSACVFGAIGDDPRSVRRGECALCLRCKPACPHAAISFGFGAAAATERVCLGRRAVAASVVAGAVYGLLPLAGALPRSPRRLPLRPPGALPEAEFVVACTRCGACVGACLTGGLQPALLEAGVQGIWTPILVGRLGGCEAECNLCGKVCSTQAIRYFPLAEKKKLRMGKAVIDRDLCLAWNEERVCYLCDEACPSGAIDFIHEAGSAFAKPIVVAGKCTGCGLCEWKCPVEQPAIYAIPLGGDQASGPA